MTLRKPLREQAPEPEPGPEAGLDAGPEAAADGGPEAGLDMGPDAGPEAGLDAGPEAGLDAGPEAGLDAAADGGRDGGSGAATGSGSGSGSAPGSDTRPGPGPGTRLGPRSRAPRRPLLLTAVALVLVAAVAAAWAGWSWYGAAHDDDAAYARTRDTVLAAGEQAVQNMNTLDHDDLDHGLSVWEASTTGDLHTQLVQGRADFEKQVQQAQTVSTAKVLSGAVTELDARTGRASVMIALRITVQAPKTALSVKESRMLGELTRTASGWKLSALGQAPLGDSADPSADSSAGAAAGSGGSPTPTPSAGR